MKLKSPHDVPEERVWHVATGAKAGYRVVRYHNDQQCGPSPDAVLHPWRK